MTDPIADMLTRIRNAQRVNHADVVLPFSKIKSEIAKILEKEGYIEKVEILDQEGQKSIKIVLKYVNSQPAIKSIRRMSKPGKRIYKSKDKLPWVMQNMGVAIVSTSQGLMTNKAARKKGIGGEIICEIC